MTDRVASDSLNGIEAGLDANLMGEGPVSAISDQYLKKMNRIGMVLHLVQGILMLVASQAVPNIKDFTKPLNTNYLVYDEATKALVSESKNVGSVEIGAAASSFLFMSALAHGYILWKFDTYTDNISNCINPARWYEYAISSSVMICLIAMLFGCYDAASLVLIFFINAVMNMSGLLMEEMNPPDRKFTRWSPFIIGCIAGLAPWIVILMYFLGSGNFSNIPGFVYGILFAYALFFNTFPINMYLQYARIGKWADYRYGERIYIVLSLLSKSLLAWLVFGGTAQPNGTTVITTNVVDLAQDTPALSTLVTALTATDDLVTTLSGAGPFTVFAPENAAFEALPAGELVRLLEPTNQAALASLLTYHVHSGSVEAAAITNGLEISTLAGTPVTAAVGGGTVTINGATVITADVPASNGVVHIINQVLSTTGPRTNIVQTAVATPTLSTLVTAITAAELGGTLSGTGPFTVFAPDNAAFEALPAGTLAGLLEPANQAALVSLLTYHVVAGKVEAADITNNQVINTVEGRAVTATLDGGNVLINGATVTTADVAATNGVVHIINQVLEFPA